MKSSGDGVFSRPVNSVGKLVWTQGLWEAGFNVLQPLHDDRSKCDRTVVEATDGVLLWYWDDYGRLQARWDDGFGLHIPSGPFSFHSGILDIGSALGIPGTLTVVTEIVGVHTS